MQIAIPTVEGIRGYGARVCCYIVVVCVGVNYLGGLANVIIRGRVVYFA